uniref:Pyrin domain-containing protein n=1 Tax=Myripristis murdjan TaxID=586833 RepID=A0A667WR24_9TELE
MMETPVVLLLRVLEDLGEKELQSFKWFLQQPGILNDLPAIPKSRLETADRQDTLNEMVKTYSLYTVEVTKRVLTKMNKNDLVQQLAHCPRSGWHWENSLNTEVHSGLG